MEKRVILLERWEEKDKEIADYYREPQRHEYLTNVSVQLSAVTFKELFMFIIEQNDFALALDFIQPKLHLNNLLQTMKTIEESLGVKFCSIEFIGLLRDFRSEIYKWAAVYSSRINSTIDKEMAKREIMTFSLLWDEKSRNETLGEGSGYYDTAGKSSFELSNFFVDEYDNQSILRIFQYLNFLNNHKGASYITKIASVIAIAWENSLLCDTYNNTLQAVFDHFGISDKIDNYKPARLRGSNYKGTIPLARAQALKFFDSIDSRLLVY
ncbi:MAG: hypothetical protein Q8R90_02145 [Bacteroidales bacterium]|nr:hypothetical protein [Bacteroidales bacterium]